MYTWILHIHFLLPHVTRAFIDAMHIGSVFASHLLRQVDMTLSWTWIEPPCAERPEGVCGRTARRWDSVKPCSLRFVPHAVPKTPPMAFVSRDGPPRDRLAPIGRHERAVMQLEGAQGVASRTKWTTTRCSKPTSGVDQKAVKGRGVNQ